MSPQCDEIPNSPKNTIILSSGASLMDMLNQQSSETVNEDDSSAIIFIEEIKPQIQQTRNSESNESDKLSTLFNPTGRERNSTGPLKQWLYEHKEHPYPKENDKQNLMKQTNMSSSQITIWFTNARAKMRKENKLIQKTKKKSEEADFNHIDELLALNNSILSSKQYIIAYSCLTTQQIVDLNQFALLCPHQILISDCVDDDTTHLIIGKEEQQLLCPLTMKLYQSIARHLFIISFRWIDDCLKQNEVLDEIKYEIRGDIPYGKYHDGMKISRLFKEKKLFENCQFFILCENCQEYMSKDELSSLIRLCYGTILDKFPLTTATDKSILTIVLCNNLTSFNCSNQQQLFELSHSNGVHFLIPEWILESIVQFNLQPFDCYENLF